jgi:hypothetical protein
MESDEPRTAGPPAPAGDGPGERAPVLPHEFGPTGTFRGDRELRLMIPANAHGERLMQDIARAIQRMHELPPSWTPAVPVKSGA